MGCAGSKSSGDGASGGAGSDAKSGLTTEQLSKFRDECLRAHNEKRAKHGSPPLTLNSALNNMAQDWAVHIGSKKSLQHSSDDARKDKAGFEYVGENLASRMYNHSDKTQVDKYFIAGALPVDQWYDEIEKFNWSNVGFQSGTGHFTQVVWKDSKQLGVGVVRIQDGNTVNFYICCNYGPGGNFGDSADYQRNVVRN